MARRGTIARVSCAQRFTTFDIFPRFETLREVTSLKTDALNTRIIVQVTTLEGEKERDG